MAAPQKKIFTYNDTDGIPQLQNTADQLVLVNALNFNMGTNIPSAASVDIYEATGNTIYITGTTNISAFTSAPEGTKRTLIFTGSLSLIYNNTSLILPTLNDITTQPNDCAEMLSLGSGNWICTSYTRASGKAVSQQDTIPIAQAAGTANDITATYSPPLSLSDKQLCAFRATGGNGITNPTFNPDSSGALTIVKKGGQPLLAGDIPAAGAIAILSYDLTNTRWELLNPAKVDETDIVLSDITDNDVKTSKHGFAPKLSQNKYEYLNAEAGEYLSTRTPPFDLYEFLGSSVAGESVGCSIHQITAGIALANQLMRVVPIRIFKRKTLTGFKVYQVVQGNYTAANYNGGGLYSYSGGTLTRIVSSTDDGNIWKATANSWITKAFSATTDVTPGIYYMLLLYCQSNQTTAPTIGGAPSTSNANVLPYDFTNSAKFYGQVASQTALPATIAMSSVTSNVANYYVSVY